MRLLDYFRSSRRNTAAVAKERLQIVIAHERAEGSGRHHIQRLLPKLEQEILQVIRKYFQIEEHQVTLQVEREGDYEVLELNITLPD
ncbi:MAG: cell division topological specificity factor MinE [Gammaproteobacteria bacterium]